MLCSRKVVGRGGGTIRLACIFQMVLYCAKLEKYISEIQKLIFFKAKKLFGIRYPVNSIIRIRYSVFQINLIIGNTISDALNHLFFIAYV